MFASVAARLLPTFVRPGLFPFPVPQQSQPTVCYRPTASVPLAPISIDKVPSKSLAKPSGRRKTRRSSRPSITLDTQSPVPSPAASLTSSHFAESGLPAGTVQEMLNEAVFSNACLEVQVADMRREILRLRNRVVQLEAGM
jgi:hypothetical protein